MIDFWSDNPCDAQTNLATREKFRYNKESWLPAELRIIGLRHQHILEIGCGQGTDAINICRFMSLGSTYIGVDFSPASIASARSSLKEATSIPIYPDFLVADAQSLVFQSSQFDAVYSMGCLHHVSNIDLAISEAYRVLKPNGKIYLALYHSKSLKLITANALRAFQLLLKKMLQMKEYPLFKISKYLPEEKFGTMLLECFGVPILNSYDKNQICEILSKFEINRMYLAGPFHSFWFIEATKK